MIMLAVGFVQWTGSDYNFKMWWIDTRNDRESVQIFCSQVVQLLEISDFCLWKIWWTVYMYMCVCTCACVCVCVCACVRACVYIYLNIYNDFQVREATTYMVTLCTSCNVICWQYTSPHVIYRQTGSVLVCDFIIEPPHETAHPLQSAQTTSPTRRDPDPAYLPSTRPVRTQSNLPKPTSPCLASPRLIQTTQPCSTTPDQSYFTTPAQPCSTTQTKLTTPHATFPYPWSTSGQSHPVLPNRPRALIPLCPAPLPVLIIWPTQRHSTNTNCASPSTPKHLAQ